MSTATEVRPDQEVEQGKSEPPILWHNAATWDDLLAALRGEPYTAKCGKLCKGIRGSLAWRSSLRQIEKCIICADLYGVPL